MGGGPFDKWPQRWHLEREPGSRESGVGTLSIIHNLHLVYIQNKEKENKQNSILYTHHYTIDLRVSLE